MVFNLRKKDCPALHLPAIPSPPCREFWPTFLVDAHQIWWRHTLWACWCFCVFIVLLPNNMSTGCNWYFVEGYLVLESVGMSSTAFLTLCLLDRRTASWVVLRVCLAVSNVAVAFQKISSQLNTSLKYVSGNIWGKAFGSYLTSTA